MSEPVTIKLSHPIRTAAGEVTEIGLKRVTVGVLRRADKKSGSDLEKTLYMLTQISEPPLSPDEIDLIDGADIGTIGKAIEGFFAKPD